MTHFNHDWDTTKNPAVPVSVGDRYYAQDLNDDFNYTKHLPYEALLQNREDGVLIPPTPSYNSSTHVLSLAGGLSAKKIACATLDAEETFVLPPKTKSVLRYERIGLLDVTLTLPQNNVMHYIVATPTKNSRWDILGSTDVTIVNSNNIDLTLISFCLTHGNLHRAIREIRKLN